MGPNVPASGLFASLRRLLGTALELAQVRLELLSSEVELEKRRLFDSLLRAAIGLSLLGVGLVLLCGFLILLVSENYRLAALGVMALLILIAALLLLGSARQRLRSPKGVFSASVSELERDRSGLQAKDRDGKR